MSRGTKALELWCRKKTEGYPGVKVENMTTSWRDGLAFCAIIHHFRPDLIEFDKLNKDEIYNNNELAFRVAEDYLGIPALLEPGDMVQYEVPDRLSILTYLSQFYQTFENQRGKNGGRTAPKRPQSTTDHGIVSPASTSPPTKVHIPIGRARREPCAKCNLPVFIAERLNVGKLLYHRTCFKCARCNSQLTLANYYETENGEFVCELCPDEEKPITKKPSLENVLTRSLSDEEKTANLQTYETPASNRFETALDAGFTYADSSEFSMARSQFFQSQMNDFITKPTQISSDNSSFPSAKSDTDKFSDSSEQTRNRIVTKDDASSSPRPVSVRVRMKLFENNEDNKSDVNSNVKQIKVVALDDLEDFDNISRQSVDVSSRKDVFIETSFVGDSNIKVHSESSVIEISDDNVEGIISLNNSSANSNLDDSCIIIEDSLESSNNKDSSNKADDSLFSVPDSVSSEDAASVNTGYYATYKVLAPEEDAQVYKSPQSISSEDLSLVNKEYYVTNKVLLHQEDVQIVKSPESISSQYHAPAKRGYYTAHEVLSPQEDNPVVKSPENISSEYSAPANRGYYTANEVLSPQEDNQVGNSPESISSEDASTVNREYYTTNKLLSPQEDVDKVTKNDMPTRDEVKSICSENPTRVNKDYYNVYEDVQLVKNPQQIVPICSEDSAVAKEYCTAYKGISPPEDAQLVECGKSVPSECLASVQKGSFTADESSLQEKTHKNIDDSRELHTRLSVSNQPNEATEAIKELKNKEGNEAAEDIIEIQNIETNEAADAPCKQPEPNENENPFSSTEEGLPEMKPTPAVRPKKISTEINKSLLQTTPEKITLNPFDDDDDNDEYSNGQDSLNPFAEDAKNEIQEKKITSSQPDNLKTPPRPKKRILALINTAELCWATPDHLRGVQHERRSINPFDDDDSEHEDALNDINEQIRERKKVSLREEDKLRLARQSINPFDNDDDEEDIEASVRPVPVPTPRSTKSNRPEPKQRDNLSVTSRGSHGGSSSSLSSNSAFGSARKKKPAPRPPVPFIYEPAGSFIASASSSVAHSPNLSGTMRSRKAKRAPLPPNVNASSTPSHQAIRDLKERLHFLPTPLGLSPINAENPEESRKEKNIKDEENRTRQSLLGADQDSNSSDKSTIGRWKRRKGQAPSRPIPERRIVKSLPVSEIKRELDLIEIQQQGLEKQGVKLEEIIREKCEGTDREGVKNEDEVSIEVEDLILQLFELVNEKNELFRRQAELMYLRRQQRLEEEYADVEYQIRCLLLQPESNKSDSDKVREEMLINRLVDIVERRNEIIECLEMDRKREAEEDSSISSQLNLYSAKRESDSQGKDSPKEEKKDKKKKHKKLHKIIHTLKPKKEKDHKVDVDKDVDESEVSVEKEKRKKFHLFK